MHLLDQQLALMLNGKFEDAWKISQRIEETTPYDLRHMFNRGWFLIWQGKHKEGYQYLDAGRHINVYGSPPLPTEKPLWHPAEDIKDKTIILNLEGGYGDTMISVRFATEIYKRGGVPIVCADPELFDLYSRVEGVHSCITINDVQDTPHDYWIPAFSASWMFCETHEDIPNKPYLTANPKSVDVWKNVISSDKPKIGIRWSGNPKFEHEQFRRFPPELMINLSEHEDLQFYSFQRDDNIQKLPENVVDLQHLLISWEDTAAALSNLDLLITSCTSVAHLSSAMGIPTWVVVPILPYHIWTYGDKHSLWYKKTTKLYRQVESGRWDVPFKNIEKDLIKKFKLTTL